MIGSFGGPFLHGGEEPPIARLWGSDTTALATIGQNAALGPSFNSTDIVAAVKDQTFAVRAGANLPLTGKRLWQTAVQARTSGNRNYVTSPVRPREERQTHGPSKKPRTPPPPHPHPPPDPPLQGLRLLPLPRHSLLPTPLTPPPPHSCP